MSTSTVTSLNDKLEVIVNALQADLPGFSVVSTANALARISSEMLPTGSQPAPRTYQVPSRGAALEAFSALARDAIEAGELAEVSFALEYVSDGYPASDYPVAGNLSSMAMEITWWSRSESNAATYRGSLLNRMVILLARIHA